MFVRTVTKNFKKNLGVSPMRLFLSHLGILFRHLMGNL